MPNPFTMVLIAVRLQISLKSDLGSVGRASTVALSHSFDIYLSLSLSLNIVEVNH